MKKSTIQKASMTSAMVICCVAFTNVVNYFALKIEDAQSYIQAYNAVGGALLIPFLIVTFAVVFAVSFIVDKVVDDDE